MVLDTDVMEVRLEVVDVLVCELDVLDLSSSSSSSLSSSSSPSSRFSRVEYHSICLSQTSSMDDIFKARILYIKFDGDEKKRHATGRSLLECI